MINVTSLWGSGEQLAPLPMAIRAAVMFLIALILIRLGGLRIFGKKSGLDHVIVIMLGAVLARGVVGASPFFSTVVAALIMVLINRALAWFCQKSKRFNNLIKGKAITLIENGQIKRDEMHSANLSESDLLESLRLETNKESFKDIEKAFLETNGRISFILKTT
jgi:uncharacterized membrane protein YcaP (DUF421 family)